MSTFEAVRAQYDDFPYPQASLIASPLPQGFARGTVNYLLRRRAADWLGEDLRIWVAGCGTQQGSMWALSYPDAEIVATDLSPGSLEIARAIAADLKLDNVRFEQQNIAESSFDGAFDLVVSTGVIHHMPEPDVGAASLRRALKPSGACLLMTYSTMLRGPLDVFRRAHRLLARDGEGADERYALMRRMLDALLDNDRCAPPAAAALTTLRQKAESDRPFVADCLLHPLEHTFDLDELLALLEAADMRHTSWWHPQSWQLGTYIRDAELVDRWQRLSPVNRWRVVYHMAGFNGPLLEVLTEPKGAPTREPYSREELLSMRLVMTQGMQGHQVEGGKVKASGQLIPYEEQDGQLHGRARVTLGPARNWVLPADAKVLLDAFDGERTTEEVIASLSDVRPREVLMTVLEQLLPDAIGILAPLAPPQ